MSVKEVNKKTENYKNTINVGEKNKISIFNISTIKKYIFFLIISKINFVHFESDKKHFNTINIISNNICNNYSIINNIFCMVF